MPRRYFEDSLDDSAEAAAETAAALRPALAAAAREVIRFDRILKRRACVSIGASIVLLVAGHAFFEGGDA